MSDETKKPATDAIDSSTLLDVALEDGKYRVVMQEDGGLLAMRFNEPWRNCVGDKLIYCMAAEIQRLRDESKKTSNDLVQPPR